MQVYSVTVITHVIVLEGGSDLGSTVEHHMQVYSTIFLHGHIMLYDATSWRQEGVDCDVFKSTQTCQNLPSVTLA